MDKKEFETKEQLELDAAEETLEHVSKEEIAAAEGLAPELSAEEVKVIKKDRLRFTTNKLSSSLALIAILLNVFYFVSIYKSDPDGSTFFYNIYIGLSVLINLMFMLAVFLCSEGVKNYNKKFAIALIVIGVIEVARIFFLPLSAHSTFIGETDQRIMGDWQFTRVIIYLALASAALIASGVIGVIRTNTLENYKKSLEEQKA